MSVRIPPGAYWLHTNFESKSSFFESVSSPTQNSGQVPPQGTGELDRPSMAERDVA